MKDGKNPNIDEPVQFLKYFKPFKFERNINTSLIS